MEDGAIPESDTKRLVSLSPRVLKALQVCRRVHYCTIVRFTDKSTATRTPSPANSPVRGCCHPDRDHLYGTYYSNASVTETVPRPGAIYTVSPDRARTFHEVINRSQIFQSLNLVRARCPCVFVSIGEYSIVCAGVGLTL